MAFTIFDCWDGISLLKQACLVLGEGSSYGGRRESIVTIQDVRMWILLDVCALQEMVISWFTGGRVLLQVPVMGGM